MELSKETYVGSPEKKDIQSVVSDIMQDETIVGKQAKKSPDNPPEKKRRGRPPKNKKKEEEETTQKEVPVKKPRGRPRKIKDTPTTQTQKQSEIDSQKQTQKQPEIYSQNDNIIPFIHDFSSTHPLHKLPHKTIKYIIFLIQLFQNNPQLHTTLPTHTLHTLLHTFYHTQHLHNNTTLPHITHTIFSALSANVDTELNTQTI